MDLLEQLVTNGGNITFGTLFVVLLIYVVKTNDTRELRYQEIISALTTDIKDKIEEIHVKIDN